MGMGMGRERCAWSGMEMEISTGRSTGSSCGMEMNLGAGTGTGSLPPVSVTCLSQLPTLSLVPTFSPSCSDPSPSSQSSSVPLSVSRLLFITPPRYPVPFPVSISAPCSHLSPAPMPIHVPVSDPAPSLSHLNLSPTPASIPIPVPISHPVPAALRAVSARPPLPGAVQGRHRAEPPRPAPSRPPLRGGAGGAGPAP